MAWALIRPFLTMIVFTVIFSRLAKLPSDGTAPYAMMVFAGMLPGPSSRAPHRSLQQPHQQFQPDQQNLFSAADRPHRDRRRRFRRFLISFAIMVVLMGWYRFIPDWQSCFSPSSCSLLHREPGPAVDHGAQREISGFPLHHPFHRAIRPLRVAGRLSRASCRRMAPPLCPQSDGRSHRRFSMVHPRRPKRALSSWPPVSLSVDGFLPLVRHSAVSETEKSFADLI